MRDFVLLAGGALYGALVVLVAIAVGKGIRAGHRAEPVLGDAGVDLVVAEPEPSPPSVTPPAATDVLEDEPVEVLSDAEVDARFRDILRPEFTWEGWL